MSFQIKDFVSIVASQVNHARGVTDKITDFLPGSVARTLIEAPAAEIEELYLQMFLGLRAAIPIATFRSFGFDKLPATRAYGYVSISTGSPLGAALEIPVGTAFRSADGRVYLSTSAVTWQVGTTMVQVPVQAEQAGISGNAASGVITSSSFFQNGFVVSNQPIEHGRDQETDAEREARFAEFVQSISRGTLAACIYVTRSARLLDANGYMTEYVTRLGVDEQPGHVRLYIYSSIGAPSPALLAVGQSAIDGSIDQGTGAITPGYRAAGVRVDVLPMTERAVDASIKVEMLPGYPLSPAVEQQLLDIFSARVRSVLPGETLYLGSLVESLLAAPGVSSIVPQTNENITCEINEALVPGVLTIAPL